MSNIKRKLTTILATDCVSFSKHMEENEENTLKSLNSCRSIIDKKIEDYNGKIFHTAGDLQPCEISFHYNLQSSYQLLIYNYLDFSEYFLHFLPYVC